MRWAAEKSLVLETKDEDLAPSDPNIPVAIAWDNCDTDATAKYESATHNGQITAIVNVLNVQPGESMRLSEPSSWTPVRDVTFEQIEQGLPRAKHRETLDAFSDVLLECIADGRLLLHDAPEGVFSRRHDSRGRVPPV